MAEPGVEGCGQAVEVVVVGGPGDVAVGAEQEGCWGAGSGWFGVYEVEAVGPRCGEVA